MYASLWGTGEKAWFGWPTSPRIEALRDAWYGATDLAAEQRIARALQAVALEEVPFVPTGQWRVPAAFRSSLSGVLRGSRPVFWNVRKG